MDHLDPDTLARIDAALAAGDASAFVAARARRVAGTYGICHQCGDELTADVLVERPTRALCPACGEALGEAQRGRRLGTC